MLATLTALFLVAAVVLYLRSAPADADRARVRRLDWQVLAGLAAVCAVVAVLLFYRAPATDGALIPIAIFLFAFVPPYLLGAGLLRSRLLSAYHRGGKSTV